MGNKHDPVVEERLFMADIASLKTYPSFSEAWNSGTHSEVSITLKELGVLCPRKFIRTKYYTRLVNYLSTKGIDLVIKSQKSKNL